MLFRSPPGMVAEFETLCAEQGLPATVIGEVSHEPVLEVTGLFALPLAEIRAAWQATIPAAMG